LVPERSPQSAIDHTVAEEAHMADEFRPEIFFDGNGLLTEHTYLNGQPVIIHYDDSIPESDLTVVRGIRCTTALRTAIDIAPEVTEAELRDIVVDFLARGLFTTAEAWERVSQPDMLDRPGAELLRRVLPR
jgi:hypothetical protein